MFLKLKCIAICLVLILTLNLAACLFVPETKAIKNNDCQLVTKKWSLEFKKTDISGRVDGEILVALSGVDRMRMLAPVFVADTLWAKAEITELRDRKDDNGLVVARLEAINQRDEVAMVCDLRLLCRKTRLKSPVGPGRDK